MGIDTSFNRAILSPLSASLLALCAFAFSWNAAAATEFPSEEAWFAEIPTLLTATRLAQPVQDAPASVTVIDRDMIRASGALEIVDLMRLVPGFQVTQPNGAWYAVTSHGLTNQDPRRMEVQVDGRSVYAPLSSTVDWLHLGVALEDIERIEVVRGSNVPTHGSNALLGVINIITRQPFIDKGTYVRGTSGGDSRKEAVVRYGAAQGNLDYRVTIGLRSSEGFDDVDDDARVGMINFRGSYQSAAGDIIDIQLGYGEGPRGLNAQGDVFDPYRDRDITTHYQNLEWTRVLEEDAEIKIHAYHNYYKTKDIYSMGLLSDLFFIPPEFIPLAFDGQPDQELIQGVYHGTAERYDVETQHTTRPAENMRLVWGVGFRLDRMRGKWLLGQEDFIDDFGQRLFGNLEWRPLEDLVLNLGAMAENNDTGGFLLSPRVAANFRFGEAQVLRASLSRSYRTFSLLEANFSQASRFQDGSPLDYRILSVNDPEPERLTTVELGYVAEFRRLGVSLDMRLYREDLKDSVAAPYDLDAQPSDPYSDVSWLDLTQGAFVYGNYSRADTRGMDVQLRWQPDKTTLVSLQYGYAETDGWILRDLQAQRRESLDDSVPRHTFSLLLSKTFDNDIQASAVVYHMSEMKWLGEGQRVDEYTRLDARLAKIFRWGPNQGEVAFIAHNLLDDYNEFQRSNLFEPRYFLQASLEFD